jgi:hypothetical protein
MTDWSLFGFTQAHHLTSVFLHGLARYCSSPGFGMTAALASALVAFLGLPLARESVAWIAERKDVLSGLFWFLTIWAYIRYTERPGAVRYALLLAAFAMGLLAKPMMVTLTFVLLLLDVWPLGRATVGGGQTRTAVLVREKVPLFILAAGASLATYLVQRGGGAVIRALDLARPASSECLPFLFGVPRPDGVACRAGRVLSVSEESRGGRLRARGGRFSDYTRVGSPIPEERRSCWWLALVSRNAGAGDRAVQVGEQARADRAHTCPW